jgi:hypothetical protein
MTLKQFIQNSHKAYREDGEGLSSDVMLSQLIEAIGTLESKPDPNTARVLSDLKTELTRRGFKN